MKYRLLELLKDPLTGGKFSVEVFAVKELQRTISFDAPACRDWCHKNDCDPSTVRPTECQQCYNHEIVDGVLTTENSGHQYPIVAGIPRILPREIWWEVVKQGHPEYLMRYGAKFNIDTTGVQQVSHKTKATVKAFGYQWTTFIDNFDYFKEIFLSFTRPFLDERDFKDKLALEIGCGSGRPAVTACHLGAEIVGMDISAAVETVFQKSLDEPRLHVVQADAYAPPFRPAFDVVYSVGVLQHIPDPNRALRGMAAVVSETSTLVLWVYGKRELWYQPIEWLRRMTTRMPLRLLHALSVLLAVLSEIFLLTPYRILSRLPGGNKLADKIPGRIYARFPFRENVVGWFDRLGAPVTYYFTRDGIVDMLKTAGFDDIKIAARKEASASWVLQAHKAPGRMSPSVNASQTARH